MAEPIAPPSEDELKAAVAEPSPEELVAASLPHRLAKWAPQITSAAKVTTPHGVEIGQWGAAIAAVLDRETSGVNVATHADGHGHGLMGIDDRYHAFATTPDVLDPGKNVTYGAGFLRDLFEKLPADMPFEEKLTRAAAAYNAGPSHLRADEPDSGTTGNDYGTDVLGRASRLDLSFLARQAASGPSQQEAAQNFDVADASGLPVNVVALDPKQAQAKVEQISLREAFVGAPVLADYAAQSPQHAAVVREEAPNLSWLERWFLGTTRRQPVRAEAVGPYADHLRAQGGEPTTDIPPVVVTAFARGMIGLRTEWEGFKEFLLHRMADPEVYGRAIGLPADHPGVVAASADAAKEIEPQKQRVQDWKSLGESTETPAEAQSAKFPQHAVRGAVGLMPYLVSGPAAPALLTAQTIGHLTADGVDPDHAATGGVIAGLMGTIGAEKITKGLGSAAEASGVTKLLSATLPKLWQSGRPYVEDMGRSAVNGWLMTAMTSITERVTKVYDKASKEGRKADPSEYAQAAAQGTVDANAALPFLGLLGAVHAAGRFAEAHGNAAAHDAVTAPLRDSKVPGEELRTLLREQMQHAGVGPRFIDAEHFDKVMRAAGLDPAEVAAKVSGDEGASYRMAKDMGGLFQVPTENYLIDLKQWHEELRDGVASDPSAAVLSREGGDALVQRMIEEVDTPIDNAKLQAIAERGLGHAPSDTEIEAVLANLRSLGLNVPPLSPVKPAHGEAITEPPVYGTAFARKLYVDMQVRSQTIDVLRTRKGVYKAEATRAQKQIDKLTTKTVDLLGSAEQSAQEGVDEALGAAEKGRDAAVSLKTSNLASVRRITNEIRKIVTQGRMAGIDPSAIPEDVATYVNAAIKQTAAKAVKSARVTPADIKQIVSQQTKQAGEEFQSSLAGSRRAEDKSVRATEKTVEAGDNAAKIAELRGQRDLNTAMHEAKEAALKRADKSIANLKDLSGTDIRERMYANKGSGHPEYGWGYDLITEALGLREQDASYRPKDFSEVVNVLRDNGEPVQFDVDGIRELVQRPKKPGDLTVDELANAENALESIAHLARERSKAYVEGKMLDRQAVIFDDIAPVARAIAGTPRAPQRRLGGWLASKVGADLDRLDAAYADFHTMLSMLGRWGAGQEARFQQVRYSENQMLSRYAKLFEAMPGDLKKLGAEDVPLPEWMPDEARAFYGDTVPRRDVWYAILRSGSEEGLAGLARGWKAEPAQIVEWLHGVANTPAEWDFFKRWWKNAEEVGDMEQAADSNRAGLPMVRKKPRTIETPTGETVTGGYAPERWHREYDALPAKSEKDPTGGVRAMVDTEHGFLKPLKPNVSMVPDISFDRLPIHIRALAKDISMGDFVRDQARMLNDPMFRKAVEPLGEWYYKALVQWHNTVATGQMQQTFNALTNHAAVAVARGYTARAVFNLNFKVMANLMGHLPFAKAVERGDINLSMGIAKGIFSPEARQYAMENSLVLRDRSERWLPKLRETERAVLGEDKALPGVNVFRTPSQYMWHGADTNLGQIIFNGLKHAAESRGMSPQEADRHADIHLDRLMPSMDIYGKPAIASNPWIGMWVLARNFESVVWNAKARMEVQQQLGIASGAQQGWARYHAQMLSVAASLGLGYYLFGGHGRNEQEQKNGWIGWGQAAGRTTVEHYTYGNYLMHLAAQNFAGMLMGEGVPSRDRMTLFDTPEHSQAQQFVNDLGQVTKNSLHNGSPSKALLAGLDAGARLLGVAQPLKSAVGMSRVAKYRIFDQNDFKSTPRTYVGDVGKIWYGDVDRYDSNLFSDADKGLADTFDSLWRK